MALATADRVAPDLEGPPAKVGEDLRFRLEQLMPAWRCHEQEEPATAQVLHSGPALLLLPMAGPFASRDRILPEELLVHLARVLVLRDLSHDVEVVAVGNKRDRQLLHQAVKRRHLAAIPCLQAPS